MMEEYSLMYPIRVVLESSFPEFCNSKIDYNKESESLSMVIGDCVVTISKKRTDGSF